MRGWTAIRLWRRLRGGCLPLILLTIIIPACSCGGMTALASLQGSGPELIPLTWASALIGIYLGGEFVRMLGGLIATVLGATSISAEVEAETIALLRTTPVPAREIVLAKFGAVFRQLRPAVITSMAARLFVPFALGILGITFLVISSDPVSVTPPSITGVNPLPAEAVHMAEIYTGLYAALSIGLAALLWLAFYLGKPLLDMLLYASAGVFGSSLARTRGGGLFASVGLRILMWVGSYLFSQVLSSLLFLPLTALSLSDPFTELMTYLSANEPLVLVILGMSAAVLWLLFIVGVMIGTTLLLLSFTEQRARRLPYK